MDSTQLERGTLEGKERDELTTIATALGGKPGSRARKAEIVDLILDLAGGGNGSVSDGGRSANAGATNDAPVADYAPAGDVPVSDAGEEPPAEWEVAAAAEEDATSEASTDAGGDAASDQ